MTATEANLNVEAPAKAEKKNSGEMIGFLFALIAAVLWGLSIYTFGVPGLYIPALCAVPVLYIMLIVISRG
ncbi:hypothetical protein [Thalassovita mediterranea]|jgi:hypothetical protein|uniref:Uncharacterized protein n=1 Tax=Thalassovita mediterranea TaxID=340021 RepID=A0A0P1GNC2_9RHOB|nr:hypothetical protein [Thalassovita mediterranea]MCG7574153.1 hypothetical protein [Phaeobacter sp. CNT1-3]CUH83876.1 hypothetical protein TM5383_01080 [Thalassovita mediterranea]SIS28226.1 hypothetical protein SAMN05421685_101434 [Thalassovita mediterranea]